MPITSCAAERTIAYSRYYTVQWDKGCLDSLNNDWQIMNNILVAVFAASLHCINESNVLSTITPQASDIDNRRD